MLARDRMIHPFLMLPFPYRREHARGLIPSARRDNRPGVSYSAVIQRATDGVILGMASLVKIHPVHRRAEIGYWLGRPHWGQGYGRDAVGAVIRFAFLRLKLRKVYAHTIVGNARSERLLQAGGLRCEGLLRSEVKTKDRWRDMKRWGLLREDAARRRRKT